MFDIGIDLDGVLYSFGDSFRKYVIDNNIRTEDQCSEIAEMDFYLNWDISHDEFLEICHAGVDADVIFFHGEPFSDARKAMEDLRYYGHKTHIITDRTFGKNNHSENLTRNWLSKYDIPYDTLTFSADKTCVLTDTMIDDKPKNYDDLDESGCYPFLYDRPWNQEENDTRRRVGSLHEFVEAVQWLAFCENEAITYNYFGKAWL